MDPHAVLEVDPGASEDELSQAYRRMAKRFHPDHAGEDGRAKMAEVNVAYELLRSAMRTRPPEAPIIPKETRPAGHWLPESVRRALGRELLSALEPDEQVELVTPTSTWASPSTVLAVTDRRLLWLLDDAVGNRVRSLQFRDIVKAEHKLSWPRKRHARLDVASRYGKPWTFAELRPATARAIQGAVQAAG